MTGLLSRGLAALAALLTTIILVLSPSPAQAHSFDSSTISTHVTEEGVDATITIAVKSLDEAMGTDAIDRADLDAYAAEVEAYLADHLSVTSDDGTEWGETFSDATLETVDGIESISIEVDFDTGDSDTSDFEITYDAVIEALPEHEAVVVLTDTAGEVSTAGVITASDDTVSIAASGDGSETANGLVDMIGYGFEHVLQGADHLLFLLTLLLVAPVVAVAGRWQRRTAFRPTGRRVLGVVSSFTLGHSITLIASALGWVQVPSRPVEVLVAISVGVAAVHAMRPVVPHGENLIAAGFGLVHGLAFAGILVNLGLSGTTSILALLAFNVGIELAQLVATATLFPSLYLLARTRSYPLVRTAGASVALAAATCWVLDRLSVLANPLGGAEAWAIAHPWAVVGGLATLALSVWLADSSVTHPRGSRQVPSHDEPILL